MLMDDGGPETPRRKEKGPGDVQRRNLRLDCRRQPKGNVSPPLLPGLRPARASGCETQLSRLLGDLSRTRCCGDAGKTCRLERIDCSGGCPREPGSGRRGSVSGINLLSRRLKGSRGSSYLKSRFKEPPLAQQTSVCLASTTLPFTRDSPTFPSGSWLLVCI